MAIIILLLSLIPSLLLYWYYFKNIDNNSYLKNVAIYTIFNFILDIISQAMSGKFTIISSLITGIIAALISVKIMEFARKQTNSFILFVILCFGLSFILSLALSFILAMFA